MKRMLALTAAALLAPTAAFAHGNADHVHGAVEGFAHPFTGADHFLAMVAVGIIALSLGGRMVLALPAAFVAAMVAGGALGAAGFGGTGIEAGIAVSLVALGAILAVGRRLPAVPALAMVALFGAFHGAAHGAEMPTDASGVAFFVSFALATALLHSGGVALGVAGRRNAVILRATGAVTAALGVATLVGAV
ncbi:HupE/UreJ family protein [Chthonobacter albigriseus]|uniref:HupE/UreJ family protein n=1 Tax=Chthonobacter albigriseus TaxID=1683161 RepID=UPI0015EFA106|nr:HupE/UreJ family protein [Chthonobacter albigriseus]